MGNIVDEEVLLDIDDVISSATKRNWKRLGNNKNDKKRLTARANKRYSARLIIPKESFDDLKNIEPVEKIINFIKEAEYDLEDSIYSIGMALLRKKQVDSFATKYMQTIYSKRKRINIPKELSLPKESDLLGLIYQCIQTEGEKNKKGSYYTPKAVVLSMVSDIVLQRNDKVLDPCCGSGIFLFNIPNIEPEQIYGVDLDPVAVMISRFNYFIKFPKTKIKPHIHEASFLEDEIGDLDYSKDVSKNYFNYIITNPPWGGINNRCTYKAKYVKSDEIFSYFLEKSYNHLLDDGMMRFLLPKSILNVKTHKDIRGFLLKCTNLREIKIHPGSFSGVMTQYISLESCKSKKNTDDIILITDSKEYKLNKGDILKTTNYAINQMDKTDQEIIDLVYSRKKFDLSDSIWALGIVTGDNKKKLFNEPLDGLEPIYTGKEIAPYKLKHYTKYIRYDRNSFQQVAKDEIYRAQEKLVYKFISKKLVFSIDQSSSLFLNSANILIPTIPNMSINSVAAFLNSELYQYLYEKKFGEIKVLKGSLSELPFVELTKEQDKQLSSYVNDLMNGNVNDDSRIQQFVYGIFNLTDNQINHIKGVLNGTTH